MTRQTLNSVRIMIAVIFLIYSIVMGLGVPNNVSYNDPQVTNSLIMACTGFIIAATYQAKNNNPSTNDNKHTKSSETLTP